MGLKVCVCGGGGGAQTYHFPPIKKVGAPLHPASYASEYIYIYIYIYLVKVANLAVECSMPYKQNVV